MVVCQVTILRVLLQITLLWMFLYFFGVPSVRRYQASKVMVVMEEKDTAGIPAPAVTICARVEGETKVISGACNGSVNVFSCVEAERWAFMEDVVLDAGKGESPTIRDLMAAELWDLQIRSNFECFTFSMNERIGPHNPPLAISTSISTVPAKEQDQQGLSLTSNAVLIVQAT